MTQRSVSLAEISSSQVAVLDHEGYIRSVSFSPPDGRLLATIEELNPTIRLWDVASRQQIATLHPESWCNSLSLSPDGRLLSVAESGSHTITLWDIASRQKVATLYPESSSWDFSSQSFSRDGTLLAIGGRGGGEVLLWDVTSRQQIATFQPGNNISDVSFSPDGTLAIAAAEENNLTVTLWDVASRQQIATFQEGPYEEGYYVDAVSFSPDGTLLATAGDRTRLWDVASRQQVADFEFWSTSVSFSSDGRLLAFGTGEGPVRLWDVASKQQIAVFAYPGFVSTVSFSPDGTLLATGGSDQTVRLWDVSEWTGEQTITAPHTLTKVSGDGQEDQAGEPLAKPFVVSVLDQNGSAFAGAVVSFSVTAGGGTLSATTATTDANGRARSTLTLGSEPGTNTVTATVEGLGPETFTAIGQTTTDSDGEEASGEEDGELADDESSGEDQPESEEQPTSTVALEGISSSHDSVREDDGQATTITLTVTLDKAAATNETITLAIVSPLEGKTAKRNEDFDATLDETITIAKGQRTGTAQLTLTPKDNTTADGDKVFGVQATSSSGHSAQIDIKIADDEMDDGEMDDGEMDDDEEEEDEEEEDDGEIVFAFAGAVEDQAYTAGAAITPLVLPEATGGEGEITYRVSELPAGLSFDDSTRTISGTPTAATDGAVEVTYTAEDSAGAAATLSFSITVNPPLSFGDFFDLFN